MSSCGSTKAAPNDGGSSEDLARPGRIVESRAAAVPPALLWLGLALALGALLPTRAAAATTLAGFLILCYVASTLGATVHAFGWVRKLSPLYWADAHHVLAGGFEALRALAFLGVATVAFGVALWAFERREISAGGREWAMPGRRRS